MILHRKATLGRGHPRITRWNLLWLMSLVQDLSFDLFTSNVMRYYCATDVSYSTVWTGIRIMQQCLILENQTSPTKISRHVDIKHLVSVFVALQNMMKCSKLCEMIGILGHDSALYGYTRPGTTSTNEIIFVMNHAPGAGSITHPVGQWSSAIIVLRMPLQIGWRWHLGTVYEEQKKIVSYFHSAYLFHTMTYKTSMNISATRQNPVDIDHLHKPYVITGFMMLIYCDMRI